MVSWSQIKSLFSNPCLPFSWSHGLMVKWILWILKSSTPSCLFSWSHGLVVSCLNSNFHFITPLIYSRGLVVSWSYGYFGFLKILPPPAYSRGLMVSWSQFKPLFSNHNHPFLWSRGLMVSWLLWIFQKYPPSYIF